MCARASVHWFACTSIVNYRICLRGSLVAGDTLVFSFIILTHLLSGTTQDCNNTISKLSLSWNKFRKEGCKSIATGLKNNQGIRVRTVKAGCCVSISPLYIIMLDCNFDLSVVCSLLLFFDGLGAWLTCMLRARQCLLGRCSCAPCFAFVFVHVVCLLQLLRDVCAST